MIFKKGIVLIRQGSSFPILHGGRTLSTGKNGSPQACPLRARARYTSSVAVHKVTENGT